MLAYIDDEPGVILPSSVQRETYSLGATYGGRRGMPVLKPVILFLTTSTVTFTEVRSITVVIPNNV